MQQMISIINENLKSVIAGIKNHKESTIKDLEKIDNEMNDKITIASKYRDDVALSKTAINKLENNISDLEKDLEDLNNKFSSKDLKEILEVGNKEINSKIIEKRSLIDEETAKIEELTKKAKKLREELVVLKAKKKVTKQNLLDAEALDKYFSEKLTSIVEYAENNVDVISGYGVKEDSNNQIDEAYIDNNIDGSVFEEIDNIDENTVLDSNIDNLEETDYEDDKSSTEDFLTNELDRIIKEAGDLLNKSSQLEQITNKYVDKYGNSEPEEETYTIEDDNIPNIDDFVDSSDNYTFEPINDNEESSEENDIVPYNDNDDIIPYTGNTDLENLIKEEKPEVIIEDEIPTSVFNTEELNNEGNDKQELSDNDIENILNDDFASEFNTSINENQDNIKDDSLDYNIDDNLFNESIEKEKDDFTFEESNDDNLMLDIDLEDNEKNKAEELIPQEEKAYETSSYDTSSIINELEKLDANPYKDLLSKYNLDLNLVNNKNISNISVENMDKIIDLLKRYGVNADNIKNVFSNICYVDPVKLEKTIMKKRDTRLTDLIFESSKENVKETLKDALELSDKEISKLKSNVKEEAYRELNMFSNIVKQNVETLKSYNIDNLKDCILTHPMRFLDNPDDFKELLDKYDTNDLVRCINKNPAVLDKL